MRVSCRVEIDGESNALFEELKLNHAPSSEKVGEIAYSERGFVGNGLQQLFGMIALRCVDAEDCAVRSVVDAQHLTDLQRAAADVLVGNDLLEPRAEGR